MNFDPRITPARPDLAAKHLEGKVTAARFVAGEEREVIDAQAPVRRAPAPDARADTEALMGERVTVYEIDRGRLGLGPARRRRLCRLAAGERSDARRAPRRRTRSHAAHARVSRPLDQAAAGRDAAARQPRRGDARAGPLRGRRRSASCRCGILRRSAQRETDFVAVAERFLGTPYLWGGKTNLGLDCSGLVQVALDACGIACPRDSDMQEHALGTRSIGHRAGCGAAIWCSGKATSRSCATRRHFIHANAFHMAVAVEPIATALARITAAGNHVTSVKRL